MHRLGIGLALVLTACGSSEDGSSTNDGAPGSGESGGVSPAFDAGAGGSGGKAGLGGSTGSGGASSGGAGAGGINVGSGGTSEAGGHSGTGGSGTGGGGSDSGAPHVVGKCDGLGAVGQWEEITPPEMTPLTGTTFYRPSAFSADPVHSGTVYIGTDSFNDGHSKGVFKTTDCGASWVHVSTGQNSDAIDGGRQWTFAIDFQDSTILYANSGYFKLGLYKSTNGGIDWADIQPKNGGASGFAGNLQMDPEDPKHLLLSFHDVCGGPNGEYVWSDQVGCFAETKDGGATWKEHYGTPKWPAQVRPLMLHGSTWLVLADSVLWTNDGGATYKSVLATSAGGHSSGTLGENTGPSYYIATSGGIVRSAPGSDGTQWTDVPSTGSWLQDIVGNGTTLFASTQGGVITSPETDGQTWKLMPGSPGNGSCFEEYDLDHHVLYASCGGNGMWRVVTE